MPKWENDDAFLLCSRPPESRSPTACCAAFLTEAAPEVASRVQFPKQPTKVSASLTRLRLIGEKVKDRFVTAVDYNMDKLYEKYAKVK